MIKFFRLTVAAAMMAGLVSVASGAKAQSTGGVSLLDPTTAPIVGGIVEALVADSGLTGTLFFTVLNPGNIPDIGLITGLAGPSGGTGVLSAIPGVSVLTPIAFPLLEAVNGFGLPLLDPSSLGGVSGASAGDDGSPLAALGGLPLVGDLTGVLGLAGGGADPAASGAGLPVVGPLLAPVLGLVGGLLGGG